MISQGGAVPFGPGHQGKKEIHMFTKTVGLNIKGYVIKLGILVEKLPPVTYIAAVMAPDEYAEESFETAEAAIHWAQSRATWKTAIDGIPRHYQVRWFRGEERGMVEVADVHQAMVVHVERLV
jgi:hypothetical protein